MRRFSLFAVAVVVATLLSTELKLSLPLFDIGPDLVILVVTAFAIGERPRTATVAAFAAGLFRDLLISTPAGLSAFAYAVPAYVVAQLGIPRQIGPIVGVFAGATFFSQLLYGFGAVFLGPQVNATPLPRMLFVTTAYNALISPLLMPVLNRIVRAEGSSQIGSEV